MATDWIKYLLTMTSHRFDHFHLQRTAKATANQKIVSNFSHAALVSHANSHKFYITNQFTGENFSAENFSNFQISRVDAALSDIRKIDGFCDEFGEKFHGNDTQRDARRVDDNSDSIRLARESLLRCNRWTTRRVKENQLLDAPPVFVVDQSPERDVKPADHQLFFHFNRFSLSHQNRLWEFCRSADDSFIPC